jgi:hypothetical protein
MAETLTEQEITDLVERWYRALDVHAPVEELYAMLLDDGNEMDWPEGTTRGHAEFNGWYQRVTRVYFDEVHTVEKVAARIDGSAAEVEVVVNWQASTWNPPEPTSSRLAFDAYQTWEVIRPAGGGHALIKRYVVDRLEPTVPDA